MNFKNLKDVTKYFSELNKNNYYLDYILEEGTVSLEWYEAILEKVKEYKPKRVIDIGSGVNMFGYLFANEGIEYIGIDEDLCGLTPITGKNIRFIHDNYYNIKEQFKDDIIISCLCVSYLIPIKDVLGKILIINDSQGTNKDFKCTAKVINLKEKKYGKETI